MPTSQRWPNPAESREIGDATEIAAGVTVAVGGWGACAGVRRLVGDGVLSDSAEASTVSVAAFPAESLVEVLATDGVGEGVRVAILVAAAVLVGELISVGAGVLVGRLTASGVGVGVAFPVEVGVLVGLGEPVAVGKGG